MSEFDNADFMSTEDEEALEALFETPANELEGDARTVTIRTSGGSTSVPWSEGITLEEAFQNTSLVMRTRADFYLDDAQIEMGTVLPAGAVITAIGATQKGG